MPKEVIYSNGEIQAEYLPGSRNVLFITFQGIVGRLGGEVFASRFLEKNGYECILFSHNGRTFFQGLSLEMFRDIVLPYTGNGKRVVLYGSSLGGYAAVYYAGAVCGQALALSPRCSADPIFQETRYSAIFKHIPINELPLEFLSPHQPIIVYDPEVKNDKVFVEQRILPSYPASKVWEIPNAMHPVGPALNNSGALQQLVFGAAEGKLKKAPVDVLRVPAYTALLSRQALDAGDEKQVNNYIQKCLLWGGHQFVIPVIRKAINARILKFFVEPSDLALGVRNEFIAQRCEAGFNHDIMASDDLILLHIDLIEYSAALALSTLKMRIASTPSAQKMHREISSAVDYLRGLPRGSATTNANS